MPGLCHDLVVRYPLPRRLRHKPRPQAVTGIRIGVQPDRCHCLLHHSRCALAGKAARTDIAMSINGTEEGPTLDARRFDHSDPRQVRPHRAGRLIYSLGDTDGPSLPFLIRLGATQRD